MNDTTISRRAFLQATAVGVGALAAGTALVGLTDDPAKATADEASGETKVLKTLCKGCVGNCGVLATVKDGRVVKLEGDPDQLASRGTMCAKGLSYLQALYNPNRLKYPMRRAGAKGENKWERITWDEALDEIADQLMELDEKYGPEGLYIGYGGGGHPYGGNHDERFLHTFGSPNIFEPGGMQCLQPRQTMAALMWGGSNSDPVNYGYPEAFLLDDLETKAMVMWGTNPNSSNIGQIGQHFVNLRAQGCKTVVVDPRLTPDASKADVWLPVRPGSDLALMMCWINYILENDLYDHEAVLKWTNLPYLVNLETKLTLRPEDLGEEAKNPADRVVWDAKSGEARVMAYPYDEALEPDLMPGEVEVNGMRCKTGYELLAERVAPFTLEKAAEVCWLEPDKIEQAIRIYTDNSPAAIAVGMSSDHSKHSTQAGVAQMILEAIMGNFCKPGVLMQQFGGGKNPFGTSPGTFKHYLSKEQYLKKMGVVEYKACNKREWSHNSSIVNAMITGEPYKPRILIEESLNKLMNMPNAAKWAEGFMNLDYMVHHTMYPTSESMYADILLPQTEWLEMTWTASIANRVYVRQPTTHLFEALDEITFLGLLAQRMAAKGHPMFQRTCDPDAAQLYGDSVPEDFVLSEGTTDQIPWWSSTTEMMDTLFAARGSDMTWDDLVAHVQENGFYRTCEDDEYIHYGDYFKVNEETGLPQGFGTPSKKIELYGEQIVVLGRTGAPWAFYELPPAPIDYDPLPYYEEPVNSPLNPDYADYPLVMTGGHISTYTHGTLRNVPWMRERHPVPDLTMNPVDAAQYGIADGDWVWVESKIGKTQGRAAVNMTVAPGVVHMERFWFPETLGTATHGFTEMNVNMLTDDQCEFNPIMGTCTYRGFQVKVSKADAAPAGVWTEPEQFAAWLPDYEGAEATEYSQIVKEALNA